MIYFSDVDVVLKLVRCGFLPYLPELLGVSENEISIQYLASLKARLTRPNKKLTNAEYQRHLAEFCTTHQIIGAAADITRQEELLQSGMDPGEAILFAEAEATGGIVVTGDKRALIHYARHSTPAQRAKLKVVCWEQLLLRVHQIKGYDELKHGGCEYLEEGLLSLAFSSGQATQEEHALEAIRSYLKGVKSHSGDILQLFDPDL
ncbi:MAG: hypothetical protein Q8M07_04190 [Prosthecobacter sp.]|nr:hypothetical protein [Prosthecobacter sp.]